MVRHGGLCVAILFSFAGVLAGSGCSGGGQGTIEGRLASSGVFGQASAALAPGQNQLDGIGRLQRPLSLDGVFVELLGVGLGDDPDAWSVVELAEPQPDGSFSFTGVSEGDYALRLRQPEFGGVAYAIDATEFHLDADQTVSLILPLVTTISVTAPGVGLGAGLGEPPVLDPETGKLYGASTNDHELGGFWALDPERGSVDVLLSRALFSRQLPSAPHSVTLAKERDEVVVVMSHRIVSIDLSIFSDLDGDEVIDYDDPEVRVGLGDKVRWRLIPQDDAIDPQGGLIPRTFLSGDESVLYVSIGDKTQVIDLDTLEVRRVIAGWALGYHPFTDQLVFGGPGGVLLVDASQLRDVGVANVQASLGVAPVPGRAEFIVAYDSLSSNDVRVPFIAVIDDSANILSDQRAAEYLGIDWDPEVGAPSFDASGEYFMLGAQGFRILPGGGFESVGAQVPLGASFLQRVSCNRRRVFDPVNRYEIWHDCRPDGMNVGGAMALISADKTNIPVSVRINSTAMVLDPTRGRAMFFSAIPTTLIVSVVHYADPGAGDRPERTDILAGEEYLEPGAVCSPSEPCEGNQVCRGITDTAWTGNCVDNPRQPYLPYCGGMTDVACDDGFTCELENPTNPESFGVCTGHPNRDYENHGPVCASLDCPEGFSCNGSGHCVPRGCRFDSECELGEVCGVVSDVGRLCVSAGPLADGEICHGPEECLHGACLDTGLPSGNGLFARCAELCYQGSDCPEGSQCVLSISSYGYFPQPFPYCADEGWLVADSTSILSVTTPCTVECEPHETCNGDQCQIGFQPRFDFGQPFIGGCVLDHDCAVPAECLNYGLGMACGFSCMRNRDCLWPVDCMAGLCPLASDEPEPPQQPQYQCNDGLGCGDDEMCVASAFTGYDDWWFFCFDEDPCFTDADCAEGYVCDGVCTESCEAYYLLTAADCDPGWQCVLGTLDGSDAKCLPPVCDCPDSGGHNVSCVLDTEVCFIDTTCSVAPCDATYGPDNPSPEADGTCCAPGNPCGLSGTEICDCPPSCDWWTPTACPTWENCPPTGGVPTCPAGYTCSPMLSYLFGERCIATP